MDTSNRHWNVVAGGTIMVTLTYLAILAIQGSDNYIRDALPVVTPWFTLMGVFLKDKI